MPDGQVVFEITGDNREVRRSLQDTTRAIEQESRNWDNAASTAAGRMENSMGGAFKKISIAAAASTVGKVLLDWGKSAVAAASDLQEVQNVVDVTFGTSAVQIDAWAKKAQTQFGLTETQAKKFTSTLGAMMKSAGMAGPEIVSMSTDLAGLAADMASFYNLDFETAFQKIRSGISGEAEPLKQLGINMSTANLQAFALTQGITKAFDKMSQGEQTLLRYQYLMSATADAQGDFARTSDGFANSQRRLETALETINTALGSTLLNYITPVVAGLADIVTGLTTPAETTVLDNFNGIDLDTAEKIADIKKTADEANALVGVLNDIAASTVKTEENTRLEGFISTLSKDIGGLNLALLAAQMGNVPGALEELGEALKAELGGDPDKWRNLLQAISQNLPGVTSATGKDTTTADFLSAAAAAADDLGADYSQYWGNLLSALGDHAGDAIAALAGGQGTGAILSGIAAGSNELGALSGVKWSAFIGAVNGLESDTPKNLSGVADALSKNLGGDAGKWETLLQAIGNNLGAVTTAVGADGTKTADWLAAAASAADDLGPEYAGYWQNLLTALGDNAGNAIRALAGGDAIGGYLSSIAEGSNRLGALSGIRWSSFIGALQGLDGKESIPTNLSGVADALAKNIGGSASQWETLLTAIGTKLPGVTTAVGDDGTQTKDWLSAAADAANDLGGDYSTLWKNLLQALGDNAAAAIQALAGGSAAGESMGEIAANANLLSALAGPKWGLFISAVNGLDNSTPANLQGVADALSTNLGGSAAKWETLLSALSAHLPTIKNSMEGDTSTVAFLRDCAEVADDLGADYSALWANLLQALGSNAAAAISALSGGMNSGMVVRNIALGANLLGDNAPGNWSKLFSALQRVNGLQNIFSDSGAAGNVESLAKALSENSPDTTRAEAWQTFLGALQQNSGALTALTKTSADETSAWLSSLASAANTLSPENANGWSLLFGSFVSGLPGLQDTEEGQQFFQSIAQEFLAMGMESEEAKAGLLALGMSTDEIDQAQRQWLETCKRLVKTIPGLAGVVNTQTGSINGGTKAIREYVDAWQKYNEAEAAFSRYRAKSEALNQEFSNIEALKQDVMVLQKITEADAKTIEANNKRLDQITQQYVNAPLALLNDPERNRLIKQNEELKANGRYDELQAKQKELNIRQDAYNEALERQAQEYEALVAIYGDEAQLQEKLNEEMTKATEGMTLLEKAAAGDEAAISSITTATQKAVDALTALEEYQAKVREETAQNIAQVVKGFENIVTPAQRAKNEMADLTKQIEQLNAAGEDTKSLETTKKGMEDSIPSVQKMTAALESQLKFMREYQAELQQARDNGVDQGILAILSDGSQESFDYLYALNHTGGDIGALNQMYREVQAERETMADTLTESQLRTDAEYKNLKNEALLAVEGLKDLKDPAYANTADMMAAIVQALQESQPGLAAQVEAINAILSRIIVPGFIATHPIYGSFYGSSKGSHANGLDNVPYDGYLAYLHQGERVQTAAEAELSRRYGLQQPGMDYGAMGSAIGANMPGMGNMQIVWRGRVVADVLSEMQGDRYRALERSGWKS